MNTTYLKILGSLSFFTATLGAASLEVSQDATVWGGTHAGTNYGSETFVMSVGSGDSAEEWRKGYLLFDASSLPLFDSVESLSFTYYTANYSRSAKFYLLEGSGVDAWSQGSITWNSAPGNVVDNGRTFGGAGITVTHLGTITGGTNDYGNLLTLTLSGSGQAALLNALNTGDRKVTIVFAHDSSNRSFSLASTEHASMAAASLSYTPGSTVPEPASAAAFAGMAGAVGALAFRRAKR